MDGSSSVLSTLWWRSSTIRQELIAGEARSVDGPLQADEGIVQLDARLQKLPQMEGRHLGVVRVEIEVDERRIHLGGARDTVLVRQQQLRRHQERGAHVRRAVVADEAQAGYGAPAIDDPGTPASDRGEVVRPDHGQRRDRVPADDDLVDAEPHAVRRARAVHLDSRPLAIEIGRPERVAPGQVAGPCRPGHLAGRILAPAPGSTTSSRSAAPQSCRLPRAERRRLHASS
jgi:hypothetical protein